MFLEIDWNWSLLPMTFSMSLLSIFNRTISLNVLGELYEALLGLGMITNNNILKCISQWPKSIHALAILIELLRYKKSLTITLRYLQDNLLGLGVNKLLHLIMELLNSSLEKEIHFVISLFEISSNNSGFIWQFCVELKDEWRAC